jgi:hypothetical protein
MLMHISACFFGTEHLPITGESRISKAMAGGNRRYFALYSTHETSRLGEGQKE